MLNSNKPGRVSLLLYLFFPLVAVAQQYQKTIAVDPNVRIGRLPNGFTYYVRKNIEPANRAILYLATKVGSVLENDNQQGLAHFIEHMGFDGTTHYPKNELINYLQKAGIRFGADLNAYTNFDETVYQLPIPTDDPAVLSNGIQIIRDWAQEATLDPADMDKERGVVLEEKRYRSGSNERLNQKIYPLLFNSSRYGKRLPIGTEEVLTTFKPETVKQFYHDWYRPDLEAIIAVGDFDVDEMVQTIKAKFSDLKNPEHERDRPAYTIPLLEDHQFAAITDKEHPTTYAEILLKHRSEPIVTEADYCDNIIQSIFNILIQNRYRELRNLGNIQIMNAGASIGNYPGAINVYNANVTTTTPNLEYSLKAIWRESIRAAKFGFTKEEFTKAYNTFYGAKYYANQQREKTKSITYVNQYLNNFLRGDAIPGEWEELKLVQYFLPKISLLNVDQFGNHFISSPNRDVIIMGPEKDKDKLPDMQTVDGWLNDVLNENITAIRTNNVKESLITKRPSKSKILSQKTIATVNVTEMVLSNGLKVVLKPTEFGTNDIRFTSFGVGGTEAYSITDRISAISAVAAVRAGGLGDLNYAQLKQYLANRQVSVNPYIDRYLQGVSGSCTPSNLETALQLTNQYFIKPRKDSLAYADYMGNLKTMTTSRNSKRDSARGMSVFSGSVFNRAFDIYKERFANAADFTFVFVGNFDVKDITPLLERYLGSLPSTGLTNTAKTPPPVSRRSRTTYSGLEPKANVTIEFLGDYTYNRENNIQFQALSDVLKIRLMERLRQQESGIYSTNVNYNLYTVPTGRFTFTISFVCAPDNVEKLTKATLDEINKIKSSGPDIVNIEKYKAANNRLMETQLKTNAFWLSYLYQQYLNKGDVGDALNYQAMEDNVNPESLKTLVNTYFITGNYERRVVLPESMKK
ncbi:MAG: insulinase family protein [Mucilaginibacter sp.]|uniref:M16 family metallopeptidase n=1 Tax=Mucilaginibacter sp. TaxID=1882438 RepID=UPI003264467B